MWQALSAALDDRESVTLSGGSATTAVATAWVNTTVGVTSGLYEGRWGYNQQSSTQAKVSLYAAGTGTITTTPSVTANAAGHGYSLTGLFPVRPYTGADTDYVTITNRALGRMHLRVPVSVPITTSDRYSMVAYPSLVRPGQLGEIREPSPVSGRSPVLSDRGWRLVPGSPAYLQTDRPFRFASDNLEVEWDRQAVTWIKVGSVWGESTGLSAESDEAIPTVDDWLPFALVEALEILVRRSPGRPNAEWLTMLQQAKDDVARSPYRDRTAEPVAAGQGA
jgi:hypothetical protein